MQAVTVIATHTNTDFDAFASQLAARRLYPDATVAVAGALNRNVRDFYRLHADELGVVEAARIDTGAIRRLIVVETVSAGRLGENEAVVLDPSVEKVVFDHHAGELPGWADPATSVISADGALTTTLVGVIAERELTVTQLEATAFALGIHEDTGSLTYPTATPRDGDALAWCIRHGARQDSIASFLHTPLAEEERALLNALMEALEPHEVEGIQVLVAAVPWSGYVEGVSNLAHKIDDRPIAVRSSCWLRWTTGSSRRRAAVCLSSTPARWPRRWAEVDTPRRRPRCSRDRSPMPASASSRPCRSRREGP